MRFEDKGHNTILNDPDNTYAEEFDVPFGEWYESLGYDPGEDKERFIRDKAEYIYKHLDHYRWSHRLDEELFDTFLAFYEKNI
jgi:hypothetical protein